MMLVKTIFALGTAFTVAAWVLVVPYAPEATQMSMPGSAQIYRDIGLLPQSGTTIMSSSIGHDVFEVPGGDKLRMQEEMAAMDMNAQPMAEDADHAQPSGEKHAESAMSMETENHDDMAASDDHGEEEESGAGHDGGAGITLVKSSDAVIDKTIEIGMRDWGYDIDHAMVMEGQTVRLVVTNNGNTPHEFMLMSMAGMDAVRYRLERADWNLLEHEALFEVPVLMPGDTFETVIKIEKSGMWMFMCMFPYHMQMGMMGMMMTPDQMGNMGAM